MRNTHLTDEQVDREIERLTNSPLVQLARQEQRIRYRRRQYLYQLRWYEKQGRNLEEQGITMKSLESLDVAIEEEMDDDNASDTATPKEGGRFTCQK